MLHSFFCTLGIIFIQTFFLIPYFLLSFCGVSYTASSFSILIVEHKQLSLWLCLQFRRPLIKYANDVHLFLKNTSKKDVAEGIIVLLFSLFFFHYNL